MYDLEIIVPVNLSQSKYAYRYNNIPKTFFWNCNNYNVLLTLLIDKDIFFPKLYFPCKLHCNYHISKFTHPASKIFDYIANSDLQSKWIAKFDDDSLNDIDSLISNINQDYRFDEDHYLVTCLESNLHSCEKYFGIENLLHEHEGCVISNSLYEKIRTNQKELLIHRSYIEDGFTDQFLAHCAILNNCYPHKWYNILSRELFDINCSTLFGGDISHYHSITKYYDKIINKIDSLNIF